MSLSSAKMAERLANRAAPAGVSRPVALRAPSRETPAEEQTFHLLCPLSYSNKQSQREATSILTQGVIDQTLQHHPDTNVRLEQLAKEKSIIWRRIEKPSITRAMNLGLKEASGEVVLFLDDDIEVTSPLVEEHAREYLNEDVDAVVGQVVQSWEQALDVSESGYRW